MKYLINQYAQEFKWSCPSCNELNQDFGPDHHEQPTVEPVCSNCEHEWFWAEIS